jgi:hypothetical protein
LTLLGSSFYGGSFILTGLSVVGAKGGSTPLTDVRIQNKLYIFYLFSEEN